MEFLRQRGISTAIRFPMVVAGSTDLAGTADWTPVNADGLISKDGGNFAALTNTVSATGGAGSVGWTLTLTATEMDADEINIQIVDSATKAVEDQFLVINCRLGQQISANKGILDLEVDNATFTATTTQAEFLAIAPTLTEEATADHFIGRLLLFTDGATQFILTNITDSELANSKIKLTYDTIVTAPADNATATIL